MSSRPIERVVNFLFPDNDDDDDGEVAEGDTVLLALAPIGRLILGVGER
jgi:hypothetical protein